MSSGRPARWLQLRYLLARDSALLGVFIRALFNLQRKTARRLGIKQPRVGALAFLQRFGSALQLTPHFHVLLPEAVFEEVSQTEVRASALPPPDDEKVRKNEAGSATGRRVVQRQEGHTRGAA